MTTPANFEIVTATDSPDFAAALAIYVAAFPAAERHPVDTVRQRVADGRSQLQIARCDGRVAFMALLWPFIGTPFILLDYLATAPEFRGRGIASAFMEKMRAQCAASGANLVMEVENPDDGDNAEQRRRRLKFYRHLGARQLEDVHYMLPPLHGNHATQMLLMLFPGCAEGFIRGEIARQLIIRLYAELYGRGQDDPLLNGVLTHLQPRINLI